MPRIGLDRRLPLEWMDAAAGCTSQHPDNLRDCAGCVAARVFGSSDQPHTKAQRNDLTVLRRIWMEVPEHLRAHRCRALKHLDTLVGRDRLWIHWGMALGAYPFFRDVCTEIGSLLSLQADFRLSTLIRRVTDRYGGSSTLLRALQRLVRTLVGWETLVEGHRPGTYTPAGPLRQPSTEVACWLVQAALLASASPSVPVEALSSMPVLFPFDVHLGSRDLACAPELRLELRGLDRMVVEMAPGGQAVIPGRSRDHRGGSRSARCCSN